MLRLRKRLARRRPEPVASFQGLEQLEPRLLCSGDGVLPPPLEVTAWGDSSAYEQVFEPRFVAEGRWGDRGSRATFELDLGPSTSQPARTGQYNWAKNTRTPFSLTYDDADGRVTFVNGPEGNRRTLAWLLDDWAASDADGLFLRAAASKNNSSLTLDNLRLRADSVGGEWLTITSPGDATTPAVLRADGPNLTTSPSSNTLGITGVDLQQGFTLTGESVWTWSDATPPRQSAAAFQVKVGDVYTIDLDTDSDNDGRIDGHINGRDESIEHFNITGRQIQLGGFAPMTVTVPESVAALDYSTLQLAFDFGPELEVWTQQDERPLERLDSGVTYDINNLGLGPGENNTILVRASQLSTTDLTLPVTARLVLVGPRSVDFEQDTVHVQPFEVVVDLDIDSDNDNGFDSPDHGPIEEHMEGLPEGGKWIMALWGDRDADGVGDGNDFDGIAGARFTPLEFQLTPERLSMEVRFDFDPTSLRLWRSDAPIDRSFSAPGLEPGMAYDESDFTRVGDGGWRRLYVEALGGDAGDADGVRESITLSARDPDTIDAPWSNIDRVHVIPMEVALRVDADRDGAIEFESDDDTSPDRPFRFWLNNNADRWVHDVSLIPGDYDFDDRRSAANDKDSAQAGVWDAADQMIGGVLDEDETADQRLTVVQRDLEDFARVALWIPNDLDYESIEFRTVGDNAPRLRLWPSVGDGVDAGGAISSRLHAIDASVSEEIANVTWSALSSQSSPLYTYIPDPSPSDFDSPLLVTAGTPVSLQRSAFGGYDEQPGWNSLFAEFGFHFRNSTHVRGSGCGHGSARSEVDKRGWHRPMGGQRRPHDLQRGGDVRALDRR